MTIDERLKTAAIDSFNEEFGIIYSEEAIGYNHEFSGSFRNRINGIADMTGYTYVRFGRNMMRRSLVAAIVVVMIVASCGMAYALGSAAVNWFTQRNDGSNKWSIWFESEGDCETRDSTIYRPTKPADLTVVRERYDSEASSYEVIYSTEDGKEVTYIEVMGVNDEGKYFGASATGQHVEDVTIGDCSGKHFFDDSGNYNTMIWTDGYSLFMIDGEYDYDAMLKMCETLEIVTEPY